MKISITLSLLAVILFTGCTSDETDSPSCAACPTITSVSPSIGFAGDSVKIIGTQFKNVKNVYFGNTVLTQFTYLSDTALLVKVPEPAAGKEKEEVIVSIEVADSNRPSATLNSNIKGTFTYRSPMIHKFSPLSATYGKPITITGEFGDYALLGVLFNNVPATSFQKINSKTITAVVPKKAGKGIISIQLASIGRVSTTQSFEYESTYKVSLFVSKSKLDQYATSKQCANLIQDIAFNKDKFYVANYLGGFFVIDTNGTPINMMEVRNTSGQLNPFETVTSGSDGGVYVGGLDKIVYLDARNNMRRVTVPNASQLKSMTFFDGKVYATKKMLDKTEIISFNPNNQAITTLNTGLGEFLGICGGTAGLFCTNLNAVFKMTPMTLYAGNQNIAASVDGVGSAARFNKPASMVMDSQGRIYVADTYNHQIRLIETDGTVKTIVGSGIKGSIDGIGKNAQLSGPSGIELVNDNTLYIVGNDYQIRKITIE